MEILIHLHIQKENSMTTKAKGKAGPTTSGAEGRIPDLTIRNAVLMYRNFSGAAKRYNAAGLRNFHVKLDLETAKMLSSDGWNVKYEEPRDPDDDPTAHMKVNFSFEKYPPRIVLISGRNGEHKTVLDAQTVSLVDSADIIKVDLVLSGTRWEKGTDHGIKTWLRKAFITLSPDDLESEYFSDKKVVDTDMEDD